MPLHLSPVALLQRIGLLSALHEPQSPKAQAYLRAAEHLSSLRLDPCVLTPQELQQIPGIGPGIARILHTCCQTGSHPSLEALQAQTPPGLLELLDVRGLSPGKLHTLWKSLGITSVHALEKACVQGQVALVKGFAEKSQAKLLDAVRFYQESQGKILLGHAHKHFEWITQLAQGTDFVQTPCACYAAGELRRRCEVLCQLDLVWVADPSHWHDMAQQLQEICSLQGPFEPIEHQEPSLWQAHTRDTHTPVYIHYTAPQDWQKARWLLTATPEHLDFPLAPSAANLRALAESLHNPTEADIYHAAGLEPIPPPQQEGTLTLELAQKAKLQTPVQAEDIVGILHVHTTYSDGNASLQDMAARCRDLGYSYMGVSDHSQSAGYAGGLSIDRVLAQHKEIDQLNASMAPFTIFKGIESDILADGSLDYPCDILERFDFVIASVHSKLDMSPAEATQRILKAISHPRTTILGHPTGRLLLQRRGYSFDVEAIFQACQKHAVALELNAHPRRLDLDWRLLLQAQDMGIMVSINPDAHSLEGLDIRYGLDMACKGGLHRGHVLNALTPGALHRLWQKRIAH